MTHPAVTFQEEATALPVTVGIRGFIYDFQEGLPRDEAMHSPRLVNLIWTVAMEELSYGQRSGTIRHGSVQDLHCYENPPGVRGYLADGQAQVLEEFSLECV